MLREEVHADYDSFDMGYYAYGPVSYTHLDIIDIIRNSIDSDDNSWDFMCQYLSQNKDSLFDSECVLSLIHI